MDGFPDTPYWRLYALAVGPGDVCAEAREIIGKDHHALALVKFALQDTTMIVSPKDVSAALDIPKSTAADRINSIGIKRSSIG